jgi:hypothetical protein
MRSIFYLFKEIISKIKIKIKNVYIFTFYILYFIAFNRLTGERREEEDYILIIF